MRSASVGHCGTSGIAGRCMARRQSWQTRTDSVSSKRVSVWHSVHGVRTVTAIDPICELTLFSDILLLCAWSRCESCSHRLAVRVLIPLRIASPIRRPCVCGSAMRASRLAADMLILRSWTAPCNSLGQDLISSRSKTQLSERPTAAATPSAPPSWIVTSSASCIASSTALKLERWVFSVSRAVRIAWLSPCWIVAGIDCQPSSWQAARRRLPATSSYPIRVCDTLIGLIRPDVCICDANSVTLS